MNRIKISKILEISRNPSVYLSRCKYLFIISHMRSRSTVLAHVLGSNPSIEGYSELKRHYLGIKDLLALREIIYNETKKTLHNKYILDKVLHNTFSFSNFILNKKNTYFIFLLRKPEETLKSIIAIKNKKQNCSQENMQNYLTYYKNRLATMKKYAISKKNNFYYIESDDLIYKTDKVLSDLSKWLKLGKILSKKYSIFKKTGISGYGDPTENIKIGKVIRTSNRNNIFIPEDILGEGTESYISTSYTLKKYSINVAS